MLQPCSNFARPLALPCPRPELLLVAPLSSFSVPSQDFQASFPSCLPCLYIFPFIPGALLALGNHPPPPPPLLLSPLSLVHVLTHSLPCPFSPEAAAACNLCGASSGFCCHLHTTGTHNLFIGPNLITFYRDNF